MGKYLLCVMILGGCGGIEDSNGNVKHKSDHAEDGETSSDLAPPQQQISVTDMARQSVDLAAVDLGSYDMAQAPDLAQAPVIDMAQPPADLATACGTSGLACCAGNSCSQGTCMRQTNSGTLRCMTNGGCGGYHYPCCAMPSGNTYSIAGYCRSDPNAASNGNTLGWYQCTSGGCSP